MTLKTELLIQKLDERAVTPSYAHATDAGMDLRCLNKTEVIGGAQATISTGIAVAIPEGHVGLIWDKSGLSAKHQLKVMGGVIDSGYTGEVLVTLHNLSNQAKQFDAGDKIAQMIIQKVEQPTIRLVNSLGKTERGAGGYGSTGK